MTRDEEEVAQEKRDRERQRVDRESAMSSHSKGSTRILSKKLISACLSQQICESTILENSPTRPRRQLFSRRMSQISAAESSSSKSGKMQSSSWGKLKASMLSGKLFAAGDDARKAAPTFYALRDLILDLKMKPYGCVSTGYNTGMIEVVTLSQTLAGIQTEFGGKLGAFSNRTMIDYTIQQGREC